MSQEYDEKIIRDKDEEIRRLKEEISNLRKEMKLLAVYKAFYEKLTEQAQ